MRKLYYVLLFISIHSFGQKKEGQPRIDSLYTKMVKLKIDTIKVVAILEIAQSYISVDPKKGYGFANNAMQLSKSIKWTEGIAKSYYTFATIYTYDSQYKKSIACINKSLEFTKISKQKVFSLQCNAINYYRMNQYPKAIALLNRCIIISKEIDLKKGEMLAYLTLGNIYSNLKAYDKAILFYKKSNILAINLKEDYNLYLGNTNIGFAYSESERFSLAINFYKKALNQSIKNKNFLDVSDVYLHLGNNYVLAKKYNIAIEYFQKALRINQEQNDFFNAPSCYAGIGESYFGLGNYASAKQNINTALKSNLKSKNLETLEKNYVVLGKINFQEASNLNYVKESQKLLLVAEENFNNAIVINKKTNITENIAKNYLLLAKTQNVLHKNKEAFVSLQNAMVYKDSVYNQDNKETIKNLEDKREIELRDKEIKINKLAIESKEKQKWFYILGLGFLTILGGLLFYQNRKRKQINLKLETLNQNLNQANKTKTRFFSILNHDLRGPVANLIHFLHLQKDNPELLDQATKTRMQNKTITSAENLLSSMEDILLWSKGQMENFKPLPNKVNINQLFEDTKKVFSGYLKITFEYQNEQNSNVFTDENCLKTIIRNLTSNAVNSFTTQENPKIIWKAWQDKSIFYISVQDNGPGASQEQLKALYEDTEVTGLKSGLGLFLIRDMAKAIGCEVLVDSKLGAGTTFILKLRT